MYAFNKTGPNEISIYPGQILKLAPREVQQTHKLLNTGWALATVDEKTSGLIPINYVRRFDVKATPKTETNPIIATKTDEVEKSLGNLESFNLDLSESDKNEINSSEQQNSDPTNEI